MAKQIFLDKTLALIADPYGFIGKRCRSRGVDAFETRLLLQRTVCMRGAEAARVFYDPERFRRHNAAPRFLKATLFGKGGVQDLDQAAHRERKALFMSLVTPDRVAELVQLADAGWRQAARQWASGGRVRLYESAQVVLTQAVCAWAGVTLPLEDTGRRTRQLVSLFDEAAPDSWRHFRARRRRRRLERWLCAQIDQERAERMGHDVGGGFVPRALHRIAAFGLDEGHPLPMRVAAVELLNVLRPTVAVSVYITQAAHALHHHPQWREPLAAGDLAATEAFAQEVRRFYPFLPVVVARALVPFEWAGVRFKPGRRAMLDLYGTNHDERAWPDPERFRPERFAERPPGPFDLIPQGGGDPHRGHRCPGEGIALGLIQGFLRFFAGLRYELPPQDLRLDMKRLPALPRDHFVMQNVEIVQGVAQPGRASHTA